MSKEKCVKCLKVGSKETITCGICNGTYHYKCVELSSEAFASIIGNVNIFWYCNGCLSDIKGFVNSVVDLQKNHDQLALKQKEIDVECRKNMDDLKSHLKVLENRLDKAEHCTSSNEIKLKNIDKSWASIVKGEVEKSVKTYNDEVKSAKIVLDNAVQDLKNNIDAHSRENNIVIFRLKENMKIIKEESFKEDKAAVIKILSVISDGEVKERDIKRTFRLGGNKDTTRPMMIEFASRSTKNLIMENLNKIKQLDDEFQNIVVSHDLTKDQREQRIKLVAEAKQKQANDSGEYIYRVKGEPTNLRIIRMKVK